MLRRSLVAIVISLLSITSAKAIVFFEPMVGYATGSFEMKYTNVTDPTDTGKFKGDIKGLNYGARGGLELGSWQFGLDYLKNNLKKSGYDKTVFDNDKFNTTEMAALLGYRFWFARVYAGYIFSIDVDKKDIGGADFDGGKGFKFGATFYALEHIAFNLEYRNVEMDPTSTDDGSAVLNLDYSTVAFLVSFPFSF